MSSALTINTRLDWLNYPQRDIVTLSEPGRFALQRSEARASECGRYGILLTRLLRVDGVHAVAQGVAATGRTHSLPLRMSASCLFVLAPV